MTRLNAAETRELEARAGRLIEQALTSERFATIAIWPQGERFKLLPVILMRSRYPADDPAPWAVQYAGSGKYFATADDAFSYVAERGFVAELRQAVPHA